MSKFWNDVGDFAKGIGGAVVGTAQGAAMIVQGFGQQLSSKANYTNAAAAAAAQAAALEAARIEAEREQARQRNQTLLIVAAAIIIVPTMAFVAIKMGGK